METNGQKQTLPIVYTILFIYAVIPVTSAGAERSFSVLKLEKTYLRSTMSNERLNSLTLINMHKDVLIDHALIAMTYLRSPALPLPLDDNNVPEIDLEIMDDPAVIEHEEGPRDMEAFMDLLNEA